MIVVGVVGTCARGHAGIGVCLTARRKVEDSAVSGGRARLAGDIENWPGPGRGRSRGTSGCGRGGGGGRCLCL